MWTQTTQVCYRFRPLFEYQFFLDTTQYPLILLILCWLFVGNLLKSVTFSLPFIVLTFLILTVRYSCKPRFNDHSIQKDGEKSQGYWGSYWGDSKINNKNWSVSVSNSSSCTSNSTFKAYCAHDEFKFNFKHKNMSPNKDTNKYSFIQLLLWFHMWIGLLLDYIIVIYTCTECKCPYL
jgi:hypothetical protein